MVGLGNCDPSKLRLISRFRREIGLHDSACRVVGLRTAREPFRRGSIADGLFPKMG
jgi:hypothetical protein